MTLRLSLLGAAAVAALFAGNAAHAENERVLGGCDTSTLQQVQCVFERGGITAPRGLRENDNDHRGDKGDGNGNAGNEGGKGNGGGAGGNDGGAGGGGGEGGEGGS